MNINETAASDDKELPPGYEAIYSVENTNVETENIHIRPPMMMGMAESPSNTSHPPPAFSSHLHPPPPPLSQPQQAIFVQQPVFVRPLMFSKKSQAMICPNCSANIMSQTKHETGLANWLVAGGVCLLGYFTWILSRSNLCYTYLIRFICCFYRAWCGCCLVC